MNLHRGDIYSYSYLKQKETGYEDGFFDKVACIAVLIHNSPDDCGLFFSEGGTVRSIQ